jgi:hypothetical protein
VAIAELIGWLMIGAAIAAVVAQRRRGGDDSARARAVVKGDATPAAAFVATARGTGVTDESWCRAVAALCGGPVFLFDEGLRLVASGGSSSKATLSEATALHLIDLGAPGETAALLGNAAIARRGERASWRMAWEGGAAQATAIALDARRLLLCIRSEER